MVASGSSSISGILTASSSTTSMPTLSSIQCSVIAGCELLLVLLETRTRARELDQ